MIALSGKAITGGHALINIGAPLSARHQPPAISQCPAAVQALSPLAEAFGGRDQCKLRLVDLGYTGTSSKSHGRGCRWLVSTYRRRRKT
jgi:hypothetical protein